LNISTRLEYNELHRDRFTPSAIASSDARVVTAPVSTSRLTAEMSRLAKLTYVGIHAVESGSNAFETTDKGQRPVKNT
jgi:hypothetical protein